VSETRPATVDHARILHDLQAIGLRQGDLVLITADLGAVGFAERNRSQTGRAWMEILRAAVGVEGTVIVVGYTASFFRFKKDPAVVFDRNASPTSGALSKAFLQDQAVLRSAHPTCSYFGFGPEAGALLAGHDAGSPSYAVIGKVIARGGKNLMLGTVDRKNAPMAFHYAQEELGHTKQHPFCGWFQSYYRTAEGEVRLFTQWDCGGCSRGAYHLYGALAVEGAVTFGTVGNARSALMDGSTSLRIIKAAIGRNRRLTLCDDPSCLSCYGHWRNTGLGAGALFARKMAVRAWRVIKR
jgi:aminoglycoside 3-N-acetyltransferase